jgi:molybdopterin/thiamine biosynthesis adenylyltransferase
MMLQVAKNLVLAGVKSLRMVDSENLREEDATSQFLAPRDKVILQKMLRSRSRNAMRLRSLN